MLFMNRKFIFLLFIGVLGITHQIKAQEITTVNGTVKDRLTGESIIGAVIKIDQLANVVVTSNEYGFYAISLPKGKYDLRISFVGYEEKRIPILLNAPLITNIFLESKNQLAEVVVSTKRKDDNLTKAQIGTETLNMQSISKVPVIASHSSVRKFTPGFERNMSDELIQALAKNGGVMLINFGGTFIDSAYASGTTKVREHLVNWLAENNLSRRDAEAQKYIQDYTDLHNPFPTVSRVADHFDHVLELVGIDHVGLGSVLMV